MGVNLWGGSPLYVNPVNVVNTLTKVLANGKGVSVRKGLKEARVQSCEPTNRNVIQGCYVGIQQLSENKKVFSPFEIWLATFSYYTPMMYKYFSNVLDTPVQ